MSRARPAIQSLVVSCEHGGFNVPSAYKTLFKGAQKSLQSHRGFDPGALKLAKLIAKKLNVPLHYSEVTRLLIEMNRTLKSRSLFSEFSKKLPLSERNALIKRYHLPYRKKINGLLKSSKEPVLHLSVHTFTPMFNGEIRDFDIGLLYDPNKTLERTVAYRLKSLLSKDLDVRMNKPYKGTADGLTQELRHREGYVGIELEVNQSRVEDSKVQSFIIKALKEVLRE